ncbi:MAG: hypothetical protein U0325_32890 [Polyangiales bacterium]
MEQGHFLSRAAAVALTLCGMGCSSDPAATPGTDAGTRMDAGRRADVTTRPDARSTPIARDAGRADVSPRDVPADVSGMLMARAAPNGNVVLYQSYGVQDTCVSVWVAEGTPEDGRLYLRRPCDLTDPLNTWRFEAVAGQSQVYNLRSNGYDALDYCVTSNGTDAFLAIGACADGGNRSQWRLTPDPDNPSRIFQIRNAQNDADGTCLSCIDEGDAWCVRRTCWPAEPKYYPSFFTADPAM